jgi:uncharacterized UPF0160 family protein
MLTALRAVRPTHSLLRLTPFLAAPTHAPRPEFSRLAPPLSRKLPRFRSRAFTSASVRCMSAGTKRMAPKTIGTHDGSFHCDEALGCFLLHQTEAYADATIVRSRDPEVLSGCDVVIDVGATYDPTKNRFDHHQRGFDEVFGHGFVTKLSSAGLVYKHFGREIVANVLGLDRSDEKVEKIYLKVYKAFIEAVDAVDNGVNMYDTDAPARYENNTGLSARVGKLNPPWNEPTSPEIYYDQFLKAVAVTGKEFVDATKYYGESWILARDYVVSALDDAQKTHPSGEILKLPCYCPWKEHLFELESERGTNPLPKYALYEDDKGQWRIQAIPLTPSAFENRKPLPAAWRGVRDAALDEVTGIEGGIFVHAAGFIGGNKTYEGALAMAAKALEMD